MIKLKTPVEIDKMREAGQIVARTFEKIRDALGPGVSTLELNELVRDSVMAEGGSLLFYNYRGFPAHCCISINEEVVHGIPRKRRKLKAGDLVSIDIGVQKRGYCGDSAWTFPVGEVEPHAADLLEVGETALYSGIEACQAGGRISDIGRAIQTQIESRNYKVVKSFVGHGIGTKLHEDPQVPNYVDKGLLKLDPVLKPGMVLAIEPMVNVGTEEVETLNDGWTVVTQDRRLSVHFEHTVAITEEGPQILTLVA